MNIEDEPGDLWVFGYGSLMWKPGFAYIECKIATIHGFHRAPCIYSHVHRGTPDKPGLVFGLDSGGSCRGIAFRVAAEHRAATIAYLREREQVTSVYLERLVKAILADARHATALTYVADRRHPQYAGKLTPAETLRLVRQGHGVSGANPDYIRNTRDHLTELGLVDHRLDWLVAKLKTPALQPSDA
ncbi:gamma-glutamylcyclotransferase [Methylovirgula sp. 4M-Z18]|nr:gamma-glutamylcyclotransferase [Methylovirgula sp. 4M-Z18]